FSNPILRLSWRVKGRGWGSPPCTALSDRAVATSPCTANRDLVRHSRSTCLRSNSPARQPNRVPAKPDRQVARRRSCWQRTKRPSESCLPTFSEEEVTPFSSRAIARRRSTSLLIMQDNTLCSLPSEEALELGV